MRILVCGGRDTGDFEIPVFIEKLHSLKPTVIISGEATGFDALAKNYAEVFKVSYEGYPADWDTYGKAAGPIRNKTMLTKGRPDLVVAFPGGKGTANMIKQAKEAKVEVKVIEI